MRLFIVSNRVIVNHSGNHTNILVTSIRIVVLGFPHCEKLTPLCPHISTGKGFEISMLKNQISSERRYFEGTPCKKSGALKVAKYSCFQAAFGMEFPCNPLV